MKDRDDNDGEKDHRQHHQDQGGDNVPEDAKRKDLISSSSNSSNSSSSMNQTRPGNQEIRLDGSNSGRSGGGGGATSSGVRVSRQPNRRKGVLKKASSSKTKSPLSAVTTVKPAAAVTTASDDHQDEKFGIGVSSPSSFYQNHSDRHHKQQEQQHQHQQHGQKEGEQDTGDIVFVSPLAQFLGQLARDNNVSFSVDPTGHTPNGNMNESGRTANDPVLSQTDGQQQQKQKQKQKQVVFVSDDARVPSILRSVSASAPSQGAPSRPSSSRWDADCSVSNNNNNNNRNSVQGGGHSHPSCSFSSSSSSSSSSTAPTAKKPSIKKSSSRSSESTADSNRYRATFKDEATVPMNRKPTTMGMTHGKPIDYVPPVSSSPALPQRLLSPPVQPKRIPSIQSSPSSSAAAAAIPPIQPKRIPSIQPLELSSGSSSIARTPPIQPKRIPSIQSPDSYSSESVMSVALMGSPPTQPRRISSVQSSASASSSVSASVSPSAMSASTSSFSGQFNMSISSASVSVATSCGTLSVSILEHGNEDDNSDKEDSDNNGPGQLNNLQIGMDHPTGPKVEDELAKQLNLLEISPHDRPEEGQQPQIHRTVPFISQKKQSSAGESTSSSSANIIPSTGGTKMASPAPRSQMIVSQAALGTKKTSSFQDSLSPSVFSSSSETSNEQFVIDKTHKKDKRWGGDAIDIPPIIQNNPLPADDGKIDRNSCSSRESTGSGRSSGSRGSSNSRRSKNNRRSPRSLRQQQQSPPMTGIKDVAPTTPSRKISNSPQNSSSTRTAKSSSIPLAQEPSTTQRPPLIRKNSTGKIVSRRSSSQNSLRSGDRQMAVTGDKSMLTSPRINRGWDASDFNPLESAEERQHRLLEKWNKITKSSCSKTASSKRSTSSHDRNMPTTDDWKTAEYLTQSAHARSYNSNNNPSGRMARRSSLSDALESLPHIHRDQSKEKDAHCNKPRRNSLSAALDNLPKVPKHEMLMANSQKQQEQPQHQQHPSGRLDDVKEQAYNDEHEEHMQLQRDGFESFVSMQDSTYTSSSCTTSSSAGYHADVDLEKKFKGRAGQRRIRSHRRSRSQDDDDTIDSAKDSRDTVGFLKRTVSLVSASSLSTSTSARS